MSNYKYIVWVGGCDDYYTTYEKAKEHGVPDEEDSEYIFEDETIH